MTSKFIYSLYLTIPVLIFLIVMIILLLKSECKFKNKEDSKFNNFNEYLFKSKTQLSNAFIAALVWFLILFLLLILSIIIKIYSNSFS